MDLNALHEACRGFLEVDEAEATVTQIGGAPRGTLRMSAPAALVELHLRQSKVGIWTETFGPGDIDYPKLAAELLKLKIRPHVVLEQAVEAKTPNTLGVLEAHRRSLKYAARVFAKFVS